MGPLTNGALCLSTPKHNGKSGTVNLCPLFVEKLRLRNPDNKDVLP